MSSLGIQHNCPVRKHWNSCYKPYYLDWTPWWTMDVTKIVRILNCAPGPHLFEVQFLLGLGEVLREESL